MFFLLLFFDWSFGFAFERRFVELENMFLQHFKSLKWKKIGKILLKCSIIGKRPMMGGLP